MSRNPNMRAHNFKDLTGQIFGRLIILSLKENHKFPSGTVRSIWWCRCICGTIISAQSNNLRTGDISSCGCLRKEVTGERSTTHGMAKSPEHVAWNNIKSRCYHKNRKDYHRYGGRGITVCDEWLTSFERFYADMGPKPFPKASIERKDNNGHYGPDNCIWASNKEQSLNKENTIKLEFNNKIQPLALWADELNMDRKVLYARIFRYKWTVERALTQAIRRSKKTSLGSLS